MLFSESENGNGECVKETTTRPKSIQQPKMISKYYLWTLKNFCILMVKFSGGVSFIQITYKRLKFYRHKTKDKNQLKKSSNMHIQTLVNFSTIWSKIDACELTFFWICQSHISIFKKKK